MVARRLALAAALLALVSLTASANEVDIRLERVPLYQLARVVLGEIVGERYVLDGALVAAEDMATVDVRGIEPADARALLVSLLNARGFVLEQAAGVTIVKRLQRTSDAERVYVYRPRFRSVSYLQGAIRAFVPRGRFAGIGAASPASGTAAPAQPTGGTLSTSPAGAIGAAQGYPQSGVTGVVPAQGPVLASQDVLVFEGSEADVAKAERLIAELDRAAREVIVRAYVFEVGSAASDGSAVSLAINLLGGRLTGSTPAAALPYTLGMRVGGIEAAYSVLQADSRFKVLSSPTLRIRSGEHGKLSVGSEVPVLGAVSLTSAGQPAQSVEYRSSGVILDLRADVLEEAIYLVVQQQVSSFVATTSGVNTSPTLLKRDLTTNLGVRSGEVVVIGGLDELRQSAAHSGLPGILSFLGSRSRDESRSELILVLEATVVDASSH
jgi:type II/III secretion system protein